jgi:hypothetical protein
VLDLRCDPNSACRQALRPLRIRIRARSERSVSRQSRAVIPLSALRMVTPLGRGAWAHVQLAEHEASGEAYALKTISKREVLRRGTLDVVMKERRLVRMCAHPNVVELYTSYQDSDSVHLLFEHLPGGELGALLRRTGPLDQAAARFYAACVLSALEAVHDAGVVRSRPPPPPPPPLWNGQKGCIEGMERYKFFHSKFFSTLGWCGRRGPVNSRIWEAIAQS